MKKLIIAVMMLVVSVPAMADGVDGLLGALIGGAIGSRFGEGNGRVAATVAGALVGASIGNRAQADEGEYVCTANCGGTTYAQQQQYYGSAHDREVEAAAARGAAARLQREHDREMAYRTRQAYCSQDPEGCRYGRGYAYNNGRPFIFK